MSYKAGCSKDEENKGIYHYEWDSGAGNGCCLVFTLVRHSFPRNPPINFTFIDFHIFMAFFPKAGNCVWRLSILFLTAFSSVILPLKEAAVFPCDHFNSPFTNFLNNFNQWRRIWGRKKKKMLQGQLMKEREQRRCSVARSSKRLSNKTTHYYYLTFGEHTNLSFPYSCPKRTQRTEIRTYKFVRPVMCVD